MIQGLTLPPLIRWLRVAEDRTSEREERHARLTLAEAAIGHLDGKLDEGALHAHQVHPVRQEYVQRVRALKGLEGDVPAPGSRRSAPRRRCAARRSTSSAISSCASGRRKSSGTTC